VTFWSTLGRGLRLRCPKCGVGKLFTGWFRMPDACPGCGLDIKREQGYYIGAMYINYGATTLVILAVALPLIDRVPLQQLLWPLAAFSVVFPVWFFRYSRSLWLAADLYIVSHITR
jgi:uncharacterized protein (DUF983 family)